MRISIRLIAAATVLATALAVSGTSCGGDDNNTGGTASPTECVQQPINLDAALPADVPAPTGAVFYEKATQGATVVHYAEISGNDVRAARDQAATTLTDAGYELRGEDAELNVEAEAELEGGAGEVRIQVTHVRNCNNTLRLRYILAG